MFNRILVFLVPCLFLASVTVFADIQSVDLTIDDNTPNIATDYHIIIHADTDGYMFTYGKIVLPGVDFSDVEDVSFSIDGGDYMIMAGGLQSMNQILIVGTAIMISENSTVDIKIHGVQNPAGAGASSLGEFKIGGDEIIDYAGDMPTYNFVFGPTLTETTAIPSRTNNTTPSYTFTSDKAGTITYGGSCSSEATAAVVGTNTITFDELEEGTYDDCTISVEDVHENVGETLEVSTFTVDTTDPILTVIQDIPERTRGGIDFIFTISEACSFISEAPASTLGDVETQIGTTGVENTYFIRINGIETGGTYSVSFLCRDGALNVSNLLSVGPFTVTGGGGGGSSASAEEAPISGDTPTEATVKGEPVPISESETPKTEENPAVVPQKEKYEFLVDITPKRKNSEKDVRALQTFFNQYEGEKLSVNGIYDAETISAVNRFQLKYASEILAPWDIDYATGNVAIYTRKKIQEIMKNA